jgi:hypothetical protein
MGVPLLGVGSLKVMGVDCRDWRMEEYVILRSMVSLTSQLAMKQK